MPTIPRYDKDPQDVLDYGENWQGGDPGPWLAPTETISASTWAVTPAGLTIGTGGQAPSFTTTTTTVWLSGGTLGVVYTVTNHVTTSQGRQVDRSIEVKVRSL